MIIALHGLSTMHCNIVTEIRLARELGFGGIELVADKLLRFMEHEGSLKDFKALMDEAKIVPVCINAIKDVEVQSAKERNMMLNQAEVLTNAASIIGCPTLQLVPFCSLDGRDLDDVLMLTAANIKQIAQIGQKYGVRYQLEPIAYSAIHSLKASLKLIDLIQEPNIGMVIDFWHLWAGGETEPAEVAQLNKNMIYGIHFCDGKKKGAEEDWDEAALRSYLPGDGDIDMAAWVKAVKSTGYDGSWSSELYSPKHWEYDLYEIAKETKLRMEKYIN